MAKFVLLSINKDNIAIESVSDSEKVIRQALFDCKAKEKRYFKASGLLHLELNNWLKPTGQEDLVPTILNLLECKWIPKQSTG